MDLESKSQFQIMGKVIFQTTRVSSLELEVLAFIYLLICAYFCKIGVMLYWVDINYTNTFWILTNSLFWFEILVTNWIVYGFHKQG